MRASHRSPHDFEPRLVLIAASKVAFTVRPATADDALPIAALAIQVFLDTYATEGVRPDLADEALTEYSVEAFTTRLKDDSRRFILAEIGTGVVGFAEVVTRRGPAPIGDVTGARLERLYVQPTAQRSGVGTALIDAAEKLAAPAKLLWLIAWDGNERALAFYARQGYRDLGADTYTFQGHTYGTRVLAKEVQG